MYHNCCLTDQRLFFNFSCIKQHQMYDYIIKKHCFLVYYFRVQCFFKHHSFCFFCVLVISQCFDYKHFLIRVYFTLVGGFQSSMYGNQKAMLEQAEASIMYLGLNCRHCIGPGWSAFMTATLTPVSVFQQ